MSIRVLLVDEQPLIRMGFRLTLDDTDDIAVVGEAKLSNSELPFERRIRPETLRMFAAAEAHALKFVISSAKDASEVAEISREVGFSRNRVWSMPEGATEEQQQRSMRDIAGAAIKAGPNFTPRRHIILWGDERVT